MLAFLDIHGHSGCGIVVVDSGAHLTEHRLQNSIPKRGCASREIAKLNQVVRIDLDCVRELDDLRGWEWWWEGWWW